MRVIEDIHSDACMLTAANMVIADQSRILAQAHAALMVISEVSRNLNTPVLTMVRAAIAAIEGRTTQETPGATVQCSRCRVVMPMAAVANPDRCPDPICPIKPKG